jgi:hypothetical protein
MGKYVMSCCHEKPGEFSKEKDTGAMPVWVRGCFVDVFCFATPQTV